MRAGPGALRPTPSQGVPIPLRPTDPAQYRGCRQDWGGLRNEGTLAPPLFGAGCHTYFGGTRVHVGYWARGAYQAAGDAIAGFSLLQPGTPRPRDPAPLRQGTRLPWSPPDGARAGGLLRPARRAGRPRAGPRADRAVAGYRRSEHPPALQRVPPPPGDHAERQGPCRQHRLPAAPLDLQPEGRAAWRAPLRRAALPGPGSQSAAGMAGAAVRGSARRRARPSRDRLPRGPRLQRLSAGPRRDPRVRVQLEDLHRGLPGGLSRRAVPPGAREVRLLRRPRLGVRRLV